MTTQLEKTPTLSAWLEDELVPLERAALSAYFHITGNANHMRGEEFLAEVVPLVAAALAAIAPVYRSNEPGEAPVVLSPAEVEDHVFRPSRSGQPLGCDRLSIRRKDLLRAMSVLKDARNTSDSPESV